MYLPTRCADLPTDIITERLQGRIKKSSGINFARKKTFEEKEIARAKIMNFFSPENYNGKIRLMTMPGNSWEFEKQLIEKWKGQDIYIEAIEREESIFRKLLYEMPRGRSGIRSHICPDQATAIYSSYLVRLVRANIEDILCINRIRVCSIWLDFSGPITTNSANSINACWLRGHVKHLAITASRCRYTSEVCKMVIQHGSYFKWVLSLLPGCTVIDYFEYNDGTPMMQFMVERKDI